MHGYPFTSRIRHTVGTVALVATVSVAGITCTSALTTEGARERSMDEFRDEVKPLLGAYCFGCHGPEKQKGKIRLDKLDPDMAKGRDAETWHDALTKMHLGEMPPEDEEKQPNAAERETIVNWLTDELDRAIVERRSTGGRPVVRRLTRYEYANTLRDLLGLDLEFAADLPAEPVSPDGFKNNGASLGMSALQLETYLEIARDAVAKAIVTGERPETVLFHAETGKLKIERKGALNDPNAGTVTLPEYPHGGVFRLQIEASAPESAKTDGHAVMQVFMGVRPSPKNYKAKAIDEVRVTAEPQTFEFTGRMENFPTHDPRTPDNERRYAGLRIGFANLTPDEGPALDPKEKKKRDKANRSKKDGPVGGLLIHSLSYEAPIFDTWPPEHHTRILFPSPLAKSDEREYARKVLERFMSRAYRRQARSDEVGRKQKAFDEHRDIQPSLELAMRELLPEILVSPDFLYLAERATAGDKRAPLSQYELANRLSYFLWSTMPDDGLFRLAQGSKLRDKKTLESQVRAMLEDGRSWGFIEHFTDQWLNLSGVGKIAVNPDYYPDFDDRLKEAMRRETQHFFAEILRNDLSALTLLDADFTMLNKPLADHYGLRGPGGSDFVRVALQPGDHRGGILTHGSVLLANSNGDDSHPIRRGVWIRDRLLGDPPASPPPDVPELDKDDPELQSLSLRRQLEVHREKESCNSCHRNIDPWGIPLENFDAVGQWRTEIRRASVKGEAAQFNNGVLKKKRKQPPFTMVPVEAISTLPGDHQLDGLEGLKAHLLKDERDRFVRAFVGRLYAYALGRSLEFTDDNTVDALVRQFEKSRYQIDELIVAITRSKPFLTK